MAECKSCSGKEPSSDEVKALEKKRSRISKLTKAIAAAVGLGHSEEQFKVGDRLAKRIYKSEGKDEDGYESGRGYPVDQKKLQQFQDKLDKLSVEEKDTYEKIRLMNFKRADIKSTESYTLSDKALKSLQDKGLVSEVDGILVAKLYNV